ncbi:YvrJ family protein [Salimicrobium jeotgali]|nr:YvrJ family protein [Salimicrobium jeotgali]
MESSFWIDLIGNLGFPIVVTLFLLMRLERKFNQLEQVVIKLLAETRKEK